MDSQPVLGSSPELGLGHAALELIVGKLNGQLPLFNVVVDPVAVPNGAQRAAQGGLGGGVAKARAGCRAGEPSVGDGGDVIFEVAALEGGGEGIRSMPDRP